MPEIKVRYGPDGIHLFRRTDGTNLLMDEAEVPYNLWSKAPRQVSIAITNVCNLACTHCYAPKSKEYLNFDLLKKWLTELDLHGCMAVGFGGGEPTLYPRFGELCEFVANETNLALTLTTHGHITNKKTLNAIQSHVNFIRISMDGVEERYSSIRGRSYSEFLKHLEVISKTNRFGLNFVVNKATLADLTKAAKVAEEYGATELLLLPEVAVGRGVDIDSKTKRAMQEWIGNYCGKVRLAISEIHSDGLSLAVPFKKEIGVRSYAHIAANGSLKVNSFDRFSTPISDVSVIESVEILENYSSEASQ